LSFEVLEDRRLLSGNVPPTLSGLSVSSVPTSGGLVGSYYDNSDFSNLRLTRVEAVNYDWGSGSPDPAIAADTFSVKWDGYVMPLYSQPYTFYVRHDDGIRLWVNNQLVLDRFDPTGAVEHATTPITLTAGQLYSIHLEFYENFGAAVSQLSW